MGTYSYGTHVFSAKNNENQYHFSFSIINTTTSTYVSWIRPENPSSPGQRKECSKECDITTDYVISCSLYLFLTAKNNCTGFVNKVNST